MLITSDTLAYLIKAGSEKKSKYLKNEGRSTLPNNEKESDKFGASVTGEITITSCFLPNSLNRPKVLFCPPDCKGKRGKGTMLKSLIDFSMKWQIERYKKKHSF